MSGKLRCSGCGKKVRDHEPDLILHPSEGLGPLRYYHVRCGAVALSIVAATPAAWKLALRGAGEEES
jgi:hypothetical protein